MISANLVLFLVVAILDGLCAVAFLFAAQQSVRYGRRWAAVPLLLGAGFAVNVVRSVVVLTVDATAAGFDGSSVRLAAGNAMALVTRSLFAAAAFQWLGVLDRFYSKASTRQVEDIAKIIDRRTRALDALLEEEAKEDARKSG